MFFRVLHAFVDDAVVSGSAVVGRLVVLAHASVAPYAAQRCCGRVEFFLTPGGVLLALVVWLFGGAHGATAGMLAIYVGGKLGSGLHLGAPCAKIH